MLTEIEALVSGPYRSIDKNLLLQAYQEVFHISLCETCTGSYPKAYQELRTYFKNEKIMAKKVKDAQSQKYSFKPEFAESQVMIRGEIFPITADNLTDELVDKYPDILKEMIQEND